MKHRIEKGLKISDWWWNWYSVESTVTKSVDIKMIRHEFSPPNERSDIWEKLEAMASNVLL